MCYLYLCILDHIDVQSSRFLDFTGLLGVRPGILHRSPREVRFGIWFLTNRAVRLGTRYLARSGSEKLNEDLISRSRDQILGSRGPWLARQPLAAWEMVRPREEIVGLAAAVRGVDCGGRMLRREDEASLRWGTERQESSCHALRCTQSTIGAHLKPASASRRSRPVIRCGGRRNHG